MKWISIVALSLAVFGCNKAGPSAQDVASAEVKSSMGPISAWKLDGALSATVLQQMRDRAYVFCLTERKTDANCTNEEDASLFSYANAFRIFRQLLSESEPISPYAEAYKLNPAAFQLPRRYCLSVYADAGSRDARSLGPCMSAATGEDYFGIVPVP